jgi:hypothetical protein
MKRFTCQKKFGISADMIPEIIVQEKISREQLEGKMQKVNIRTASQGKKNTIQFSGIEKYGNESTTNPVSR